MKVPCLILGLLLMPWLAEGQQQYYGTRVSSIALSGSESKDDLQAIPIRIGDTLTPENVRASIEALFNTGRYSTIDVDATSAPDGTTSVTFRVRPVYFFSTFRLEPDNLVERSLSSYFRIPVGERFTTSAIDRIVQDTTELLKDDGYFQATIAPTYEFQEPTHLVFVTLKAMPGTRAKIGQIRITGGEQTFTEEELADALDLKTGDEFSADAFEKGVGDIRTEFIKLRFLNTKVRSERLYVPGTNTVDLNITIEPGQFALVQTRGFEIKEKRITELVPIYEEAAVDDDLIEEGRVAVARYMQQEGYFEAVVTVEKFETDPSLANAVQINYVIDPGAKHEIVAVRIIGNQFFESDEIRDRIKSRRGELLNHGVFSADLLEEDRRIIEAMYRNAGFDGTEVTASAEDEEHNITVVIQIKEGKRVPLVGVNFVGNAQIATSELRAAVQLKPGETYVPGAVDQARAALTQLYYSQGYADARVERVVDRVSASDGVQVTFRITEGESFRIGSILVAGNTRTKDKVVRRLSRLQEYKPFDPEAILEAEASLYATGLFTRVEIVSLDQGIPGLRNILIQIEDAKPILLTYGIGYEQYEHLRGSFEISHNNLFGLNRSISLRTRASIRQSVAQATYHEPRLFNHELDGIASSFIEHSDRPFFSANRIDFSLQVLKRFLAQNNVLFTSSWQTVSIGDKRVNPHATNDPAQQGPCGVCQIGRIGTSLLLDRRNDPLVPTRGFSNTTTFQVASPIFGSELQFTSLFNQSTFYQPLRSDDVLASSVRFGWNHPYGKTAQFAQVWDATNEVFVTQQQQLPASERFWAGGSTTLRGFGLDEARPRAPEFQQLEGGNVVVIGNVEYRAPLRWAPISGINGAVFYDTGNIFTSLANIRLREFTHSAGVGLRYQTPVGPVRFDIGFNLQPFTLPDGTPERRVRFFFTLGNAF